MMLNLLVVIEVLGERDLVADELFALCESFYCGSVYEEISGGIWV